MVGSTRLSAPVIKTEITGTEVDCEGPEKVGPALTSHQEERTLYPEHRDIKNHGPAWDHQQKLTKD